MLKPRLGEWMGGMMSGRVREHEEESHPSACPKLPAVCFLMLGAVICNHLPALKPLDMPSQGHATLYSQLPSPSRTLTVLGRTSSMCQDGQPREPSRVSATFSTAVCRSSSPSCCPRKELSYKHQNGVVFLLRDMASLPPVSTPDHQSSSVPLRSSVAPTCFPIA